MSPSQPWQAEHEVSAAEAERLVCTQFPDLKPVSVRLLAAGWDNVAYLVETPTRPEPYVFRFPQRQMGAECMESEIRVLQHVAPRLPWKITVPTLLGRPDSAYPWAFAGYVYLPGTTACCADLSDQSRRRNARPLARFLSTLHSVGEEQAREWGAIPDHLGRLSLAKRDPRAMEQLAAMGQAGLLLPDHVDRLQSAVRESVEFLGADFDGNQGRRLTLVHGDLYARHLVVDDDHQMTAVIDWGDVHLGNPAVDLAIAQSFFPPAAKEEFREEYGPIDDTTWTLARVRAIFHASVTALYAEEIEDTALLRECLTSLRHLAE